jgi:hypothetical protein
MSGLVLSSYLHTILALQWPTFRETICYRGPRLGKEVAYRMTLDFHDIVKSSKLYCPALSPSMASPFTKPWM